MTDVPATHPRYVSLRTRDAIVAGVEKGVTSVHGLIAHGRGEAFDYLLGERTHDFALDAIDAAAAMLVTGERPVVSVNGNAAALVPGELVALADRVAAPLEVNIFHASKARERAIREHMQAHGAPDVLMPTEHAVLDFIDSNRRFVNPNGIFAADVVFVPLEDGDRCEALVQVRKAGHHRRPQSDVPHVEDCHRHYRRQRYARTAAAAGTDGRLAERHGCGESESRTLRQRTSPAGSGGRGTGRLRGR